MGCDDDKKTAWDVEDEVLMEIDPMDRIPESTMYKTGMLIGMWSRDFCKEDQF